MTGIWLLVVSAAAKVPSARYGHCAFSSGGKLFVLGGALVKPHGLSAELLQFDLGECFIFYCSSSLILLLAHMIRTLEIRPTNPINSKSVVVESD
jgi:hypothetical protein